MVTRAAPGKTCIRPSGVIRLSGVIGRTALHCTALHSTALHCIWPPGPQAPSDRAAAHNMLRTAHCTLHTAHCTLHTAVHCTAHCTLLQADVPRCPHLFTIRGLQSRPFPLLPHTTVLYYCTALISTTALYCTALHCTALHCTALNCTAFLITLHGVEQAIP
jgi:hypothetical protein